MKKITKLAKKVIKLVEDKSAADFSYDIEKWVSEIVDEWKIKKEPAKYVEYFSTVYLDWKAIELAKPARLKADVKTIIKSHLDMLGKYPDFAVSVSEQPATVKVVVEFDDAR